MGPQLPSGHEPPSPNMHSLFALMGIGLRHRLRQPHLKLIAPQRHLLVVGDEVVKAVKHQVVRQEELGAAGILPRVDPAVLHLPVAPAKQGGGKSGSSVEILHLPQAQLQPGYDIPAPQETPSRKGPEGLDPSALGQQADMMLGHRKREETCSWATGEWDPTTEDGVKMKTTPGATPSSGLVPVAPTRRRGCSLQQRSRSL